MLKNYLIILYPIDDTDTHIFHKQKIFFGIPEILSFILIQNIFPPLSVILLLLVDLVSFESLSFSSSCFPSWAKCKLAVVTIRYSLLGPANVGQVIRVAVGKIYSSRSLPPLLLSSLLLLRILPEYRLNREAPQIAVHTEPSCDTVKPSGSANNKVT